MKENFDACLRLTLRHEGGFVNNPRDPGGMTNLGVTKRTWEDWTGRPATEADMRSLTEEDVKPLYHKRFWKAVRGEELPDGIDFCVFDCAVNSGPGKAVRMLQSAIGVKADGIIGKRTIDASFAVPLQSLIDDYTGLRLAFLQTLSHFPTFSKGWTARCMAVRNEAMAIAEPYNGAKEVSIS